jgi:hypothetical protein
MASRWGMPTLERRALALSSGAGSYSLMLQKPHREVVRIGLEI